MERRVGPSFQEGRTSAHHARQGMSKKTSASFQAEPERNAGRDFKENEIFMNRNALA